MQFCILNIRYTEIIFRFILNFCNISIWRSPRFVSNTMTAPHTDMDIAELQALCNACDEQVDAVLHKFSWTREHLLKKKALVPCGCDKSHTVSRDKLSGHEEACLFVSNGIPREQLKSLPPSSEFFYKTTKNIFSCTLDKDKLNSIIKEACQINGLEHTEKEMPLTGDQSVVLLTPTERLWLHQHIINEARSAGYPVSEVVDESLMLNFTKIHKATEKGEPDKTKMSELEYKVAMRDYKRRRQTYRAKNVHITQKSYTEVIREVIDNQTAHLTEAITACETIAASAARDTQSPDIVRGSHAIVHEVVHGSREVTRGSREVMRGSREAHSRSRDRRESRPKSGSRSSSRSRQRSLSRQSSRDRERRRHSHTKHRHKSHRRH